MDNQKNDISELYKHLSTEKMSDIKQAEEELEYFKGMYAKELLTNRDATKTLEIIQNLEALIEREKADYHRFKNISCGNEKP